VYLLKAMLLLLTIAISSTVTLDSVYEKVKTFPGVEISAEMVRPSSIAMTFKIAPGGRYWAKYPTTEDFTSLKERVTWMPDRRQFARSKPEEGNPLPAGFEPLWPGGALSKPNGEPTETTFAGKSAVELPCISGAQPLSLFVDRTSLIPLGTIASAGGKTYEMHYNAVKIAPISPLALTFVPPADARPFSAEPPDAKLVKKGASVKPFTAADFDGKPVRSAQLLKGSKGLVLNFWFSACTGCIQEMPFLSKLQTKLKGQQISLVGINPIDPLTNARKTSRTNNLPYGTIVGAKAKDLAQAMGVKAYPATIVLDPNGVVVDAMMGFQEERLIEALQKIGYKP
jgi:thiol-disulfide isomerase/thioredoxin